MGLLRLSNRVLLRLLLANVLLIIVACALIIFWLPHQLQSLTVDAVSHWGQSVTREFANRRLDPFQPPSASPGGSSPLLSYIDRQAASNTPFHDLWQPMQSADPPSEVIRRQTINGQPRLLIAATAANTGVPPPGMWLMNLPLAPAQTATRELTSQLQSLLLLLFGLMAAATGWMYYHTHYRLSRLLAESRPPSTWEPTSLADSSDEFSQLAHHIDWCKQQLRQSANELDYCQASYRSLNKELHQAQTRLEKSTARHALSQQQHIDAVGILLQRQGATLPAPLLTQLITGIAQDIQRPLETAAEHNNRLLNLNRQLQRQTLLDQAPGHGLSQFVEQQSHHGEIINSNLERAVWLLQAFTRLMGEAHQAAIAHCQVSHQLQALKISLGPLLKRRQLQLHMEIPPTLSLHTHPEYLNLLICNLIINSIKHGFDDQQPGQIYLGADGCQRGVVFHYHDDGAANSEQHRQQLLSPLRQGVTEHQGSGLGLGLVWRLVNEQLGGSIELYHPSVRQVGYRITIPDLAGP